MEEHGGSEEAPAGGAGVGGQQIVKLESDDAVLSPADVAHAERTEERVPKRDGYLSWDDYFMSVAFLSAMRSKDPSTQVGACIVDRDNRIVAIGYNGLPRGVADDAISWAREASNPLETKYPYIVHAEMNAILNKNASDLKQCRLYVALFPCNECTKLILQSGISEVIYASDKHAATYPVIAAKRMLDMAGITYRQHAPALPEICIRFG